MKSNVLLLLGVFAFGALAMSSNAADKPNEKSLAQLKKLLELAEKTGLYIDLTGLGVPVASWPTLAMRNLPHNQDGCKGATLTLHFRAARTDKRVR